MLEMLPNHGLHRLRALKRLLQQIDHAPEALELTYSIGPSRVAHLACWRQSVQNLTM